MRGRSTLGVRSITTRPVSPISSTRSCWGPTCPACTDPTTAIECGINRAERFLLNACTYYATVDCSQKTFDIEEACYYCLKRTAGLMVFDIVHVINNDMWAAIKRGIDRYEAETATE